MLHHDNGTLEIDIAALVENYRIMDTQSGEAQAAAVVKADAYGLGIDAVVPALCAAGCKAFFVAHAQEGAHVRSRAPDADIYVLNGLIVDAYAFYIEHRLIPCLIDPAQIRAWNRYCAAHAPQKAALYLETGFNRLGITLADIMTLTSEDFAHFELALIMSHLACAEHTQHKMNPAQLELFHTMCALLPSAPTSLANSSGVFLGSEYHFDMTRCGIALYGGLACMDTDCALQPVVSLSAHILAIREITVGETVGYGADFTASAPMSIAIISAGYGDGILRASGHAAPPFTDIYINEHPVPIIGRVSMDSFVVDITNIPPPQIGTCVELLGAHANLAQIAAQCGTIAHELLTRLGKRYQTIYKNTS